MGDPSRWDRRSVVVSAISLVVAVAALLVAVFVEVRRSDFEHDVEERESAPVLAAGVEPELRGRTVHLDTSLAGRVTKPADVPVLEPRTDGKGWLLVVPVWNIGDGLAVIRNVQVLEDCDRARDGALEQELAKERRLGFYNVAAGQSEQLRYPVPQAAGDRAIEKERLFTLIRYTDALSRRERWTCIDWIGRRLTLRTQNYDDRELD